MQTQFFKRPEGSLAYDDTGNAGEPVIMLPGMGALRSEYRFLVPKLSGAGYRAVTVDLRGQGESGIPWDSYEVPAVGTDILALIGHLNAGPAHVIGTSFAPAAVVWAAAERPESFRSLVLISPFVREMKINPFMLAMFRLMLNNPWRVGLWIKFYRRMYPARQPADFADYLNRLTASLKQPGRFAAVKAYGNASRRASDERLDRIQKPVLVVMGTRDPDFPDPAAEGGIVAERSGGSLVLIEGAGHYPQTEMPEETAPHILNFLKQVKS